MRGLDHKVLNAVGHSAGMRLVDVVDFLAVAGCTWLI